MEEKKVKEPEYITSLINNGLDAMGAGRQITIDCNNEYCVNVPLEKISETLEYISYLKDTITNLQETLDDAGIEVKDWNGYYGSFKLVHEDTVFK